MTEIAPEYEDEFEELSEAWAENPKEKFRRELMGLIAYARKEDGIDNFESFRDWSYDYGFNVMIEESEYDLMVNTLDNAEREPEWFIALFKWGDEFDETNVEL